MNNIFMKNIVHLMGMTSYKFGGVEKFMLSLIDSCPGDKFFLVYNQYPYSDVYLKELERRNVEIIVTNVSSKGLIESLKFSLFLKSLKCDIVHFHFELNLKVVYFLRKILKGNVKIYSTIHSEIYIDSLKFKKVRYIKNFFKWQFLARQVDCFLGVSLHVTNQLGKVYHVNSNVKTIYIGVETKGSVDLNPQNYRGKKKVVTNIGFDSPIKGIDIFIKSLSMIKYSNYEAWIIGLKEKSEYTKKLKQLAEEWGVADKIKWVGVVDNVCDYIQKSDLFCQTSRTEALSLAACEALMFGCPVIGSNVGGLPEVAQLTFEKDDYLGLANLIDKVLFNDEYQNELRIEAVKKWEKNFQLKGGVKKYHNLYYDIV